MMMKYVKIDPVSGVVLFAGAGPTLPSGAVAVPSALAVCDLAQMMEVAPGVFSARPQVSLVFDGQSQVSLSGCPAGSRLRIDDLAGSEILLEADIDDDGYSEIFSFPVGIFRVDVAPPVPYLPAQIEVVVS